MRIRRADAADVIDAEFEIAVVDGSRTFSLTIESSGGAASFGNVRNPEYPLLLEEALRRLRSLDVELVDAFVDSSRVAQIPIAERRIHVGGQPFPIKLSAVEDFAALRLALTRPQGDIGSARSSGRGNQRKRSTLAFRSPTPVTHSELAAALGATQASGRGRRSGITTDLSAADIEEAISDWRQRGRDAFLAHHGAAPAQRYLVVDGDDEMDAMALLLGARAIAGLDTGGPWRGDRDSVAEPLRQLGFAVADKDRPSEGPLGPDPASYVALAERLGGTDVAIRRMGRREQRFLRGALGIASGHTEALSACGLCGRPFPESFLVAAHIKPRHLCSEVERLDLPSVGWVLCVAGCDALFEQGYVGVTDDGRVIALRPSSTIPASLQDLLRPLIGSRAPGWSSNRAVYFGAHRAWHGA